MSGRATGGSFSGATSISTTDVSDAPPASVATIFTFLLFVSLMFTSIPILYEWFMLDPVAVRPLWELK